MWPQNKPALGETVAELLSSRNEAPTPGYSVLFDDVSVDGWGQGAQPAPTVSSVVQSWFKLLRPTALKKHQPSRVLLHGFAGSLNGGEMLAVLGKPGSGCTTFLKALTNMRDEYKSISGNISYGGIPASRSSANELGQLTYCAEEDIHLPTLTVYETLRFAVRASWNVPAGEHTIDSIVHCLARCFGLDHVLQTKVGNEAIRGVSGGERRRVSLAEALATCPDLLCLDNPTNGLDSTTASEIVSMIRDFSSVSRCATVMSLYQGSDAMIQLFDKVLVINSGRQIYYGNVAEAKEYFESLGFICPERTTIADFLTSMTAEPQLRHVRDGFESRVPSTSLDFQKAFRASRFYQDAVESLSAETMFQPTTPRRKAYALPIHLQIYECARRQFRVFITDYHTWMLEAACIIIQSVVLGTIFRNQKRATKSLFMLASSMFYTVIVPALQSMNEFSNTFAQRDLVARQKRYRFYRPLSYAIGLVLTDAIWKIVAIAYNIPQYFLTGLQRSADKFFTWFCIVYVEHMALSMMFRSASVFSTNMGRAVLPVALMFNVFVIYCGLYVPGPQMQIWLFWLKYINPMYYAYESVLSNELGTLNYICSESDLAPNGPSYTIPNQVCAVQGAVAGESSVSGVAILKEQYGFEVSHLWRNVGINAGLMVFFAILTAVGMELYRVPAGRLATIFYHSPKRFLKRGIPDSEKGENDDNVPPTTQHNGLTQSMSGNGVRHGRTLVWRGVALELKLKEGIRKLLDDLNGLIQPGQLTALMGVSGAGKTTLLNALAGRLEIGNLRGELSLDGKPLPKSFRRHMGYVQQQDIHLPTQTVREALQMTSKLRRPQNITTRERNDYVEEVIRLLEMDDFADALIGIPGAGMNLEQRKRVSIGVELAAAPDILFLDEPTSGLDGLSAITIIRLLKKLATSGQTILVTIHQPSAEIIEYFDHLILLLRGGKLAYQGALGDKCADAISYFQRHGRLCGEHENPAEYFLDVVGKPSAAGVDWPDLWNSSEEKQELSSQLDRIPSRANVNNLTPTEKTYAMPFHFQLSTVLQRTWLFYWRDPDYFVSKLSMSVGNALLNGLTYLNSPNSQQGLYNMVFSAFVALIIGPPLGLQVIPRFIQLRDIYQLREKGSLTYRWLAFVLSAIIVEIPYTFFTNLVYWLLWYFPVGYPQNAYRAGYSFLMYQLFGVFATSVAQLCATIMPSVSAAYAANGFFFMFFNTFAGTLTPRPVTPSGWRWYFNVSPLYYLAEGFTANAIEDVHVTCKDSETSVFQPPSGTSCATYAQEFLKNATGYLLNPEANSDCQYCRYKDGPSYYAQYGYNASNRGKDVGAFIGFIAFNLTAVLVWTYLSQKRAMRKTNSAKS